MEGIAQTGRRKGPRVAGEDTPNGLGAGARRPRLGQSILARQARASFAIAPAPCFEAIAIKSNALRFGARTPHGVVLEWSNLESGGAEEIQLVKALLFLSGLVGAGR